MPKTKAEKYELYKDVTIQGPTSFNPVKILAPNTEVRILVDESRISQDSYNRVDVMDGVHFGSTGFVPKFALLECDVHQSRAGLATVETTGVTYGAGGTPKGKTDQVEFSTGRGRTALYFALPFKGKKGCPECGNSADQHTIEESAEAKRLALAVHTAIGAWANNVAGGFMIGVLKVEGGKNQSRLAVSSGFKEAREKDLLTVAEPLGLNLVQLEDVRSWEDLHDFRGEKITELGGEKISIKKRKTDGDTYSIFLQCAGPKLLQAVVQPYLSKGFRFEGKLFMSEVWYESGVSHANYADASSAQSCEKCAVMIPRMLCGYKGKK
jgi:hypothetical protein